MFPIYRCIKPRPSVRNLVLTLTILSLTCSRSKAMRSSLSIFLCFTLSTRIALWSSRQSTSASSTKSFWFTVYSQWAWLEHCGDEAYEPLELASRLKDLLGRWLLICTVPYSVIVYASLNSTWTNRSNIFSCLIVSKQACTSTLTKYSCGLLHSAERTKRDEAIHIHRLMLPK